MKAELVDSGAGSVVAPAANPDGDGDGEDHIGEEKAIERLLREAASVLRRRRRRPPGARERQQEERSPSADRGGGDGGEDRGGGAADPPFEDGDDGDGEGSSSSPCRGWARFVHRSMSASGRVYHGPGHVLQVLDRFVSDEGEAARDRRRRRRRGRGSSSGGPVLVGGERDCDRVGGRQEEIEQEIEEEELEEEAARGRSGVRRAVAVLAAAFHDVVYLPLDGGRLPPGQLRVLRPYVVVREARPGGQEGAGGGPAGGAPPPAPSIALRYGRPSPSSPRQDLLVDLAARVFGLVPPKPPPGAAAAARTPGGAAGAGPAEEVCISLDGRPRLINEFLSAVAAVQLLGPAIGALDVLQVVACIEASVPFRRGSSRPGDGDDDEEESAADAGGPGFSTPVMVELHERCRGAAGLLSSEPGAAADDGEEAVVALMRRRLVFGEQGEDWRDDSDDECEGAVARAVGLAADFANADVGSFGADDPRAFLESTWSLLPEWYPRLLPPPRARLGSGDGGSPPIGEATARDLEEALAGLLDRYPRVDAGLVFQSFRGSLPRGARDRRRGAARRNLDCAGRYARVRLACLRLALDALEAIRALVAQGAADGSSCAIRPCTLSFVRDMESGVPPHELDLLSSLTKEAVDSRLWSCLVTIRPDGGGAFPSPPPWGDAAATRASALVCLAVSWEGIEALSSHSPPGRPGTATASAPTPPAGDAVRRHVAGPHARRLLADAVLAAAVAAPGGPRGAAAVAPSLRRALHEALECSA